MTIIDMSTLPPPAVIEPLDYEAVLAALKARLLERVPADEQDAVAEVLALESEPLTRLLEAIAYEEIVLRARINDAAAAVLLAYATGTDLDHIGARYGVARLDGEDDTRLRQRIQQGYAALGAAGPADAYRAHALAVSSAIADVSVVSSAPGRVDVAVLGWRAVEAVGADPAAVARGARLFPAAIAGAGLVPVLAEADSALLDAVRAALSAETVRPLTDHVVVHAPAVLAYEISARLRIYGGPDPASVLAQSTAALSAYLGRVRRLGYDSTLAGIVAALAVPGVQNVLLDSPTADIVCQPDEIADATLIAITIEGLAQ
jgi:phage-related baseplate assembly protein